MSSGEGGLGGTASCGEGGLGGAIVKYTMFNRSSKQVITVVLQIV